MSRLNLAGSGGVRIEKAQRRFTGHSVGHWRGRFLLREVLRNSADEEHRSAAAYVIGYAPQKAELVGDLQYALRDPDSSVRNHAMRSLLALAVLQQLEPQSGIKVQPTWFIEMLNSISWSDRNNAAVSLVNLTETRDENVISQLRERATGALLDMAMWKHLPHALPAFILLGRIAGMPETEIQDLWSKGERDKLVAKTRDLLKKK